MDLLFHKSFVRDAQKISEKIQKQAEERINLYIKDKFNPLLHFHALKGSHHGYYSINVNADIRIIFYTEKNTIHLVRIGSHSHLYK